MNTFLRAVSLLLIFSFSVFADEPATTDKDVATLQGASFFSLGGMGVVGTISGQEDAYNTILKQSDGAAKFQKLLTTAGPSGQMYALMGLSRLDKKAFEAAAPKYRDRTESVRTIEGCFEGKTTLGEFVKQLYSGKAP